MSTNSQDRAYANALEDTGGYFSPACFLHEVDPVYLGYWSRREVLVFLNELLECARAGARLSRLAQDARDPGIAALLHEAELLHASSSVVLWQEIETRRGSASPRTNRSYVRCLAQPTLGQRIALVRRVQEHFVRRIEKALPRIFDQALHTKLASMLDSHRRQIEHWQTFLR